MALQHRDIALESAQRLGDANSQRLQVGGGHRPASKI